jgi:hypothetical protein
MTVLYKQLQSEYGFKSPGFLVDENGNFNVANLNAIGSLKINNSIVLTPTTLASSVVNSSLTSVGTLTGLNVNSTSDIGILSNTLINLTAPLIEINSNSLTITSTGAITLTSGTTGTLDNITVGATTPATGTFTTLTATTDLFVGTQNIKALAAALAVALS